MSGEPEYHRFSQPLFFLRKKSGENGRNVHALDTSIAPLEAPASDCGMGLGGAEVSTARRNEVWRRGVVGGRKRPSKLVTKKLRLDRERARLRAD